MKFTKKEKLKNLIYIEEKSLMEKLEEKLEKNSLKY